MCGLALVIGATAWHLTGAMTLLTVPNSKYTIKRTRRNPSRAPSRGVSTSFYTIHEVYSLPVQTSADGVVSRTLSAIQPSGLILAARLAGYQAIYDECRIESVRVVLTPLYGTNTRGRVVMYVERDPTGAIVASVDLANDQREKVFGNLYTPISINWRPQEPDDHAFNLLNPGTTSLGSFFIKADSLQDGAGATIVNASTVFTATLYVTVTLRGRP